MNLKILIKNKNKYNNMLISDLKTLFKIFLKNLKNLTLNIKIGVQITNGIIQVLKIYVNIFKLEFIILKVLKNIKLYMINVSIIQVGVQI